MFRQDDFSEILMKLYMKSDFEIPDLPFQIGDKNFLSYMRQSTATSRKKFVTDFDGIYEAEGTEPLYKIFFRHLHDKDINPEIDPNEIYAYIKSIFQGKPIADVFTQIKNYLQSKNLKRWQYYKACERAAEEWQPNKEAWETVQEIKNGGYDITIISGSAKEALEMAAKKIGIKDYEIVGTIFEFDIFGRLKEIKPMLGEEKLKSKRRIVGERRHIAITDDMQTDSFITFGAELSIIAADKENLMMENEKQLYVFDKAIQKSFSHLLNYVRKFEYSFIRSYGISKFKERRIVELITKLKSMEKKEDFLEILELLRFELGIFDSLSSAEKIQMIINYKNEKDTEKEKNLKQDILSAFNNLPEYVNTEAFVEELRKFK